MNELLGRRDPPPQLPPHLVEVDPDEDAAAEDRVLPAELGPEEFLLAAL